MVHAHPTSPSMVAWKHFPGASIYVLWDCEQHRQPTDLAPASNKYSRSAASVSFLSSRQFSCNISERGRWSESIITLSAIARLPYSQPFHRSCRPAFSDPRLRHVFSATIYHYGLGLRTHVNRQGKSGCSESFLGTDNFSSRFSFCEYVQA